MTFVSVDASTQSIAFAIWDNELISWGKVVFQHKDKSIYSKAGVIGKRTGALTKALLERHNIKDMVIEKPIFANSPMTASNLALGQGALVGAAIFGGIERVVGVEPITWAAHIGNPNLTKKEKEQIKLDNPDASANKLKVIQRDFRKQRTMDFVNEKFNLSITDNDVGDAIAIGSYALDRSVLG